MTPQINHHPSQDMLGQFHRAELSPGTSAAIAAHLELCSCCNNQVESVIEQAADDWLQNAEQNVTADLNDLLGNILSQPRQAKEPVASNVSRKIHLLEHSVDVPHVLAKAAGKDLLWKKLPGGINQANMALDRKAQCDFLYMKPGSQIPRHRHQGKEVTLVLDGSFSDELGSYKTGDFIVREGDDSHGANSEEGCLCFTVLENPVIFTSGLARLFNPINRYLFSRNLKANNGS